jgi:hypothetical protein
MLFWFPVGSLVLEILARDLVMIGLLTSTGPGVGLLLMGFPTLLAAHQSA